MAGISCHFQVIMPNNDLCLLVFIENASHSNKAERIQNIVLKENRSATKYVYIYTMTVCSIYLLTIVTNGNYTGTGCLCA